MSVFPFESNLPQDAGPALEIAAVLRDHGFEALLAGGCVRDLLRGATPADYDLATRATPPQITRLFPNARQVGAQFGVMLVRRGGRWVEVATFRSDGPYEDGRRPTSVTFGDARQDALRRDFTINGMFLDPGKRVVLDYVGGMQDLRAARVRAVGDPARRFEEDHLRLLRGVRFAARLDFEIEPATMDAIRANAPRLARVAAERVREELEKMLAHASRGRAFELLGSAKLLTHLWPGAAWDAAQFRESRRVLGRLPARAAFEAALAAMLLQRSADEVTQFARRLTLSNQQRTLLVWLIEQQHALDDLARLRLADLKRLLAGPSFDALRSLRVARGDDSAADAASVAALDARVGAIAAEQVQPPPWVTGDDLAARGVPQGPIYRRILDALYTRQLDEELPTRAAALAALEGILAAEPSPSDPAG